MPDGEHICRYTPLSEYAIENVIHYSLFSLIKMKEKGVILQRILCRRFVYKCSHPQFVFQDAGGCKICKLYLCIYTGKVYARTIVYIHIK